VWIVSFQDARQNQTLIWDSLPVINIIYDHSVLKIWALNNYQERHKCSLIHIVYSDWKIFFPHVQEKTNSIKFNSNIIYARKPSLACVSPFLCSNWASFMLLVEQFFTFMMVPLHVFTTFWSQHCEIYSYHAAKPLLTFLMSLAITEIGCF
jgi:hypothetical protein